MKGPVLSVQLIVFYLERFFVHSTVTDIVHSNLIGSHHIMFDIINRRTVAHAQQ